MFQSLTRSKKTEIYFHLCPMKDPNKDTLSEHDICNWNKLSFTHGPQYMNDENVDFKRSLKTSSSFYAYVLKPWFNHLSMRIHKTLKLILGFLVKYAVRCTTNVTETIVKTENTHRYIRFFPKRFKWIQQQKIFKPAIYCMIWHIFKFTRSLFRDFHRLP